MGKTKLRVTVISIFVLLFTGNLFAQQQCSIKNFNAGNAGMQNSIIDMALDADGYLWMGTQNGIIRYDGTNFKTFLLDTTRSNNNIGNIVLNISGSAAQRTLLIRTSDGVVHTIKNGRPILYSATAKTTGYGYELNGRFPNLKTFNLFNLSFQELMGKYGWYSLSREVLPLNNTDFIAFSSGSSYFLYYKDGSMEPASVGGNQYKMFLKSGNYNMYLDKKDNLNLFDSTLQKFNPIEIDQAIFKNINNTASKPTYYWDAFNDDSYCYYNNIFYLLQIDAVSKIAHFIPKFSIPLEGHFWSGILYDPVSTTYFLTTLTEGMYQVKLKAIQSFNLNTIMPADRDINNTINYALLKTSDSTVLTTTGYEFTASSTGISVHKKGNIFGNREAIALLGDTAVLSISKEKLFYFKKPDGFTQPQIFNDSFNKGAYFITLLQSEGDSIWACTDKGIYSLKRNEIKTLLEFNITNGNPSGAKLFYRLTPTTAFFCNDYGLFKINTTPPYTVQAIPEMKDKQVRYVTTYNNMLILSVYKNGIYVYKDNRFYKVPLDEDKPGLALCHSTYIDKNGEAWIPTDKGLFRSSIASLVEAALKPGIKPFFYYYGTNDGIVNTEFNGRGSPPFAALPNGQLFYPTMGGIVTFNPAELHNEILRSSILIDKVSIDNIELDANAKDSFELSANFNYMYIDFSAAHFGEPENLIIESNFDNNGWVKVAGNTERFTLLGNISNGYHILVLRKRVGFGNNDFV